MDARAQLRRNKGEICSIQSDGRDNRLLAYEEKKPKQKDFVKMTEIRKRNNVTAKTDKWVGNVFLEEKTNG